MTRRVMFTGVAACVFAGMGLFTAACSSNQGTADKEPGIHRKKGEPAPPMQGVAVFTATKGNDVKGVVTLTVVDGDVHLQGDIRNLSPGKHGFHIHEFGDLRSPDGKSAGGHFNPEGHKHGAPDDANHHAGDLGNIVADEKGVAQVDMKAKDLQLRHIIGRALVVHGGADDLKSQPSGDAGPRVAVGVIGIAQHDKSK